MCRKETLILFVVVFTLLVVNTSAFGQREKTPLWQKLVEKPLPVIKTNLLFWGMGTANLGTELHLSEKISLDIPFVYSPYKWARNYRCSLLMLQPELRYWLREPLQGHFFGVNVVAAWYNIAFNDKNRYQDRKNRPAYGAGISYGYALPLGKQWGMEFTAGFGYLRLDYDVFYNINNGAKINSQQKNYWGLTKLGVNLIYKFSK